MHEENGHHHHHHEHEDDHTGGDLEKIEMVISYLIKHNEDHIKDLNKWHKQSIEAGIKDIASEFRKIIKLSEKIDRRFKSTLGKIKKHG